MTQREHNKGAGIRLIQVVHTSDIPLKVEYKEIDETHSFFSHSFQIMKDGLKTDETAKA